MVVFRTRHFAPLVLLAFLALTLCAPSATAAQAGEFQDQVRRSFDRLPINTPSFATANLVNNGDFEHPTAGDEYVLTFGFGPDWLISGESFDGWTIPFGNVDLTAGGEWQAASHRALVDLNGYHVRSGIYQDLATVPGQNYRLRFAMAGNPADGPVVKRMKVTWGAVRVATPTFDTTGRTLSDMGWVYHDYSVTATETHTRLAFTSLIEGAWGPTIDDVSVVPASSVVPIDIKPGSANNVINLKSHGMIPVAILTTAAFDATGVDPLSVRFGPGEASEAHGRGHTEDVDGDGDVDLVLHFTTQDSGLTVGDTQACLTGATLSGEVIEGCGNVTTRG